MLADVMERAALHERLTRIWRTFTRDYMTLASALREHRRRTRQAGAEPIAVDRPSRDVMHQLHAIRIALIQRALSPGDPRARLQRPSRADAREPDRAPDPARRRGGARRSRPRSSRSWTEADDALDFGEPPTYEGADVPVLSPGAHRDPAADRQALRVDPSHQHRDRAQCRRTGVGPAADHRRFVIGLLSRLIDTNKP